MFDSETSRELSERNRNLETRHISDYHRLKSEAERKSAKILQVIDSINREQKADQDRLDEQNSRISELTHDKVFFRLLFTFVWKFLQKVVNFLKNLFELNNISKTQKNF